MQTARIIEWDHLTLEQETALALGPYYLCQLARRPGDPAWEALTPQQEAVFVRAFRAAARAVSRTQEVGRG